MLLQSSSIGQEAMHEAVMGSLTPEEAATAINYDLPKEPGPVIGSGAVIKSMLFTLQKQQMQKPVQKAKNKLASYWCKIMNLRRQVNKQAADIKELNIEIKELKKNMDGPNVEMYGSHPKGVGPPTQPVAPPPPHLLKKLKKKMYGHNVEMDGSHPQGIAPLAQSVAPHPSHMVKKLKKPSCPIGMVPRRKTSF